MKPLTLVAVGLGLVSAGVYAAVAVYGAMKITTRVRKLPELDPAEIAPEWEAVTFPSRGDGKRLAGWWFPAGGGRALVLIHGHGQNRTDPNWGSDRIAREFHRRDYSVLLFDLRGHGESEHDRLSFGVRERNDVLGALDFVLGRGFSAPDVAMIGISYGAASMLMAAPEMPDVGALVADSSFAEVWPVIGAEIPRQRPLIGRLRPRPGIQVAARLLFRVNLNAARPVDAVIMIGDRPILYIHGAADEYVPPVHSERLHVAHGHPLSELWLVPEAGHALTYTTAPDEFIERVTAFLETHMRPVDAAIGSRQSAIGSSPP